MKVPESIRWRIQLWHGAILLAVIASFCTITYGLERTNIDRVADTELSLRLDSLADSLGRQGTGPPGERPGQGRPEDDRPREEGLEDGGGAPGPRSGFKGPPPEEGFPPLDGFRFGGRSELFDAQEKYPFYFQLWGRGGNVIGQSGAAPGGMLQPERSPTSGMSKTSRVRDGFREMYIFTPPGECILVGRSARPVESELHNFAVSLVSICAAVLVFGLAGGWWTAALAIRPIKAISASATRISAGNLAERIDLADSRSELGQLAAVLNETFSRLDAAFAQQARFTSDAAHELRTPVAVILGQTQLALARDRSVADYRETIAACRRAAQRMHGLIEALLELSLLDGKAEPLNRRDCDLAEIARESMEMIQPLADERKIALSGEFSATPCSADAGRLSQILINLLSNAVKFSGSGDGVRLSTRRENGCAIVKVEDSGPGISAEHLGHIFDRFYRVDGSRNRAGGGGAGLGLAISKSIAEAHGGGLAVESAPGKGTTFTLRIPAGRSG